jgi:non-homologous end joining protein Ku
MVELAEHILATKAAHFDPASFKDDYEAALKALVKKKAAGQTITAPEPEEQPSNVVSLMDALRQSLKGKATPPRQPPPRRPAKKTARAKTRLRKAG